MTHDIIKNHQLQSSPKSPPFFSLSSCWLLMQG
jgi:hypothetical protein